MTTRSLSFSSLRALAAARRHDLAGNWSNIADRDLHRTATDLLAQSYDDGAWADRVGKTAAEPIAPTFDLEARRARGTKPVPVPSPDTQHARAS
jgi:hypothetical protein